MGQLSNKIKKDFVQFLLDSHVIQFGSYKTKAGRMSPYFFNFGKIATGMEVERIGYFYFKALEEYGHLPKFDTVFGPAYKGIPIATSLVIAGMHYGKKNLGLFYNRKESKDHGEGGLLVGEKLSAESHVLIVDDVLTSGKSIVESINILRESGTKYISALVGLDRCERAEKHDMVARDYVSGLLDVPMMSLITIDDVLEIAPEFGFSEEILEQAKLYRKTYGA